MSLQLHDSTFDYLKATNEQIATMGILRSATRAYAMAIEALVPDGPDKTYILRKVRETGMWANVAVTRNANGTPRE